jgi:hypothetical protein
VLSLVIVPSFFLIMDDLSWLLGRIFGGLVGKKEDEPEAPDPARADANLRALASRLDKLETAGAPAKGGDLRHAAE